MKSIPQSHSNFLYQILEHGVKTDADKARLSQIASELYSARKKVSPCNHVGSFHPLATVQGITQSPYISVLQCFNCGILEKTTATVTLTRLAAPRRSVTQWFQDKWRAI